MFMTSMAKSGQDKGKKKNWYREKKWYRNRADVRSGIRIHCTASRRAFKRLLFTLMSRVEKTDGPERVEAKATRTG